MCLLAQRLRQRKVTCAKPKFPKQLAHEIMVSVFSQFLIYATKPAFPRPEVLDLKIKCTAVKEYSVFFYECAGSLINYVTGDATVFSGKATNSSLHHSRHVRQFSGFEASRCFRTLCVFV